MAHATWNFLCFWWKCCLEGWHTWHWILGGLEVVLLFLSMTLRFRKKRDSKHHIWKQVGEYVKLNSWKLCLVVFAVSTFLVEPYVQWHEANDELSKFQSNKIAVQWQPPPINEDSGRVEWFAGGTFHKVITFGNPLYFGVPHYNSEKKKGQKIHDGIDITMSGNRLYFNVNIPTSNQLTPVTLVDGITGVIPEGWDFNSDENTLEIVDDQRNVMFQEIRLNTNSFLLRGAIIIGRQVAVFGESPYPQGFYPSNPVAFMAFRPSYIGVARLFKYPSSKFPHFRVDDEQ